MLDRPSQKETPVAFGLHQSFFPCFGIEFLRERVHGNEVLFRASERRLTHQLLGAFDEGCRWCIAAQGPIEQEPTDRFRFCRRQRSFRNRWHVCHSTISGKERLGGKGVHGIAQQHGAMIDRERQRFLGHHFETGGAGLALSEGIHAQLQFFGTDVAQQARVAVFDSDDLLVDPSSGGAVREDAFLLATVDHQPVVGDERARGQVEVRAVFGLLIRVISAMPKWNPGKNKGQPVRVAYTLPIKFKLD